MPTMFRIAFAMVSAAPVFSRMVPMIVPQRITIPILVMMLPKPPLTSLTTLVGVISDSGKIAPQIRPTASATTSMTTNGCIFSFEIAMTIATTDRMISANKKNVCMSTPPFIARLEGPVYVYNVPKAAGPDIPAENWCSRQVPALPGACAPGIAGYFYG